MLKVHFIVLATLALSKMGFAAESTLNPGRPSARRDLRALSLGDGDESGDDDVSYGIVIDAGSTGCRLHVYRWPQREYSANDLPAPGLTIPIELATSILKSTPGIDKVEGVAALRTIVARARGSAPFTGSDDDSDLAAATPIFLKATAGMRILSVETQSVQLTAVRDILRSSGFLFRSDAQARVISGEEEGIFGWLTVNYQLKKLVPAAAGTLSGSLGALDLGGASTQITFKPMDPNLLSDSFSMRLGDDIREDLYTHSFLYYGANEAATRMNQAVMFAQWPTFPSGSPPAVINNPCYFVGQIVPFQDPRTGAVTNMTGTGDFDACRNGPLASIINKRAICLTVPRPTLDQAVSSTKGSRRLAGPLPSPAPAVNTVNLSTCSVQGEYQPKASGVTFVAFSAFAFVWNALEEPTSGGSLASFAAKARPFCALSWTAVQQQYSVPARFLAGYCFSAAYTTALLVDGYNLDPTDTTALQVAASPDDYGWALGSIIYEANALGYEVELPFATPFYAMVGVSAVSFMSACVFALLWFGRCPSQCMCCCSSGKTLSPVSSSTAGLTSDPASGPTSHTKSPLAHVALP